MLLGQHLVYELLRQGYTGISCMAEYTAKLVEDHTADFIINNGGWVSEHCLTSSQVWLFFDVHHCLESVISFKQFTQ